MSGSCKKRRRTGFKVHNRALSVNEIAGIQHITSYEAQKEIELSNKVISVPVNSTKREARKQEIIRKIITHLPCTFSVLERKTGLSTRTLSKYLIKLVDVRVLKKYGNMYYLDDDIVHSRRPFEDVIDRWISGNREYQTPSVSNPNPRGSAVRLAERGSVSKEMKLIRKQRKAKELKNKP